MDSTRHLALAASGEEKSLARVCSTAKRRHQHATAGMKSRAIEPAFVGRKHMKELKKLTSPDGIAVPRSDRAG
jgi:hypothetical protein